MATSYLGGGINLLIVRLLGLAWAAIVALWATNVLQVGGSVVFLMSAAAVAAYLLWVVLRGAREQPRLQVASVGTLCALFVAVPVVFDPTTADVFNLTKFTIVVCGALVLAGLLALQYLHYGRGLLWRNGLHWPVLALLAWTGISTIASTNLEQSILGFYKSYDGLLTHLALAFAFFSIVHFFTINRVKTLLSIIYFGGGGLVILYGLLQLHDRTFEAEAWDWVPWGASGFRDSAIWSALGNPNHLAGFLAMLLPIGFVLLLVHRDWRARLLTATMSIWLVLEVIHTTTRGAWLAVLISIPVLLILIAPEVKARWTIPIPLVGLVGVSVLASALILGASRNIPQILASIFDFSRFSSATQRLELWKSAIDMGADRPIFGFGPDTYRLAFQQYQTEKYVENFGIDLVANGPHNTFLNYLATEGVVGLLLFVAVLVFVALRAAGAWRRLRVVERSSTPLKAAIARDGRLLLAGSATAVVAYLVQASFNVQQIALSFLFWALLGVVCVIALDGGVPTSLRPGEILDPNRVTPLDKDRMTELPPTRKRATNRAAEGLQEIARARLDVIGAPERRPISGQSGRRLATAGIIIAVAAALWPLSGPYRADHSYLAGRRQIAGSDLEGLPADEALALRQAGLTEIKNAVAANPWEPLYLTEAGRVAAAIGQLKEDHATLRAGATDPMDTLHEARRFYERALALEPQNAKTLFAYASVLVDLAEEDEDAGGLRGRAYDALRRAIDANPWYAPPVALLAQLLAEEGEEEEARAVIEAATEYVRNDDQVEAVAADIGLAAKP